MEENTQIIALGSSGDLVLRSEDGEIQELPLLNLRANDAFVYLLIDCSGSMAGGKLSHAKSGSMDFVHGALAKGYQVGLISFDTIMLHLCSPTNNVQELSCAVDKLNAGGRTNMAQAIEDATIRLVNKDAVARAIVIVTDGKPDDPESALNAAARAEALKICILTIGTGDADPKFLADLASDSDLTINVSSDKLRESISSAAGLLPEGN